MRLLVLFDLPVVTKAERRAYTVFRRFLINDGYDMIQFSVYGRILNGNDALEKHMKRLVNSLPAHSTAFGHSVQRDPATCSTMIRPGQSERSDARFSG